MKINTSELDFLKVYIVETKRLIIHYLGSEELLITRFSRIVIHVNNAWRSQKAIHLWIVQRVFLNMHPDNVKNMSMFTDFGLTLRNMETDREIVLQF